MWTNLVLPVGLLRSLNSAHETGIWMFFLSLIKASNLSYCSPNNFSVCSSLASGQRFIVRTRRGKTGRFRGRRATSGHAIQGQGDVCWDAFLDGSWSHHAETIRLQGQQIPFHEPLSPNTACIFVGLDSNQYPCCFFLRRKLSWFGHVC